jgi:hypothetical protein
MNYRKSIDTTLHALREFEPGEEIISILEDFANDEIDNFTDRKSRSIEDKLKDLRNRYDSGMGQSRMNLYPSNDTNGTCHPFCLAIANKKFDKPRKGLDSGFKGIMLEMAAHWFGCLSINKRTLILTSTWDNDVFSENYKNIIDQYTKVHNKRVFIIEVGPTGFFPRYPY